MMTCQELVELLGDLVAQELSPEQQAEADHHLKACPPCAAVHETYQLTIHLAHRLAPLPVPPSLLARLRAGLESATTQPRSAPGTVCTEDKGPSDTGAPAGSGNPDPG